jgi:predicted secreted protein
MRMLIKYMENIELKINQEFEINLVEAGTAGYLWSAESDNSVLIEKVYISRNLGPELVGCFSQILYKVKSETPGQYKLVLNHMRPWNREIVETKEFLISVT